MGKSVRKCEACGVRRVDKSTSDIFLARFPLDPNRCRLWVKATGYEDLAYLPIQRLNENKFICGNHFSRKMFTKKGKRLKRNAVPDLRLNTPLSDEILADFPICASGLETNEKEQAYRSVPRPNIDNEKEIRLEHGYCKKKHIDHNYTKTDEDAFEIPELQVPSAYSQATKTSKQTTKTTRQAPNTSRQEPNTAKQATNTSTQAPNRNSQAPIIPSTVEEPDDSFDLPLDDYDDHEDDAECLSVSDASCQEDDDDLSFYLNLPKKSMNKDDDDQVLPEPNEDLHEGFMCNNCSGEIKGYRYTCVQCPDYDLCGSCEARGAHCLHYVLRIPRPKPYAEIQSVVNKIREQLKYGVDTIVPSALLVDVEHEIKEEVKEEGDPLEIDVAPTNTYEDDIIFTEEASNFDERPNPKQKTTMPADTILRNTPTKKFTKRISTPSVYTTTNRHDLDTVITITPPDHTKLIQVASTTTRFTASTTKSSDGNTVLTLAPQESIKRPYDVHKKNAKVSTENPRKKLKMVFTPSPKGVEAGGRLVLTSTENSPGIPAQSRRQFTDSDPLQGSSETTR